MDVLSSAPIRVNKSISHNGVFPGHPAANAAVAASNAATQAIANSPVIPGFVNGAKPKVWNRTKIGIGWNSRLKLYQARTAS